MLVLVAVQYMRADAGRCESRGRFNYMLVPIGPRSVHVYIIPVLYITQVLYPHCIVQ